MQAVFYVTMFVLGACLGSFLCCQARRLHLRETKHKKLGSRSVCMYCKKTLKWYENIPLLSWTIQKGKCRSCHTKIGIAEPLSELGVALAFVLLSINFNYALASPLEWATYVVTLLFTLALSFLAIYDGIYGELPSLCLFFAVIFAAIVFILSSLGNFSILEPIGSVLILGGLYLFLYLISKGKWVGDGDWILGVAIGLALASPWLALIVLFVSNVLACLVMLPSVKSSKNHHIHFGPFLVVAYVLAASFSGLLESVVL